MGFESLADKLAAAFKRMRGKGKLTEADIKEVMREIRVALLEADVNFKVVREFIANVSERAVGAEVMESLTPAQQVVKIVNEELIKIMGGDNQKLEISSKPPTIIMLVGLQGSGKTTHVAKLALNMRKNHNKRPLLIACDIYRPAAIKQLQVVGETAGVPVFEMGTENPVKIAKEGIKYAEAHGNDMVFIDTAGRLQIDEDMMNELKEIKRAVNPTEILLIVDAMTGQEAVNVAEKFNEAIDISGIILTKMDGDTRGGAAISVRHVTGKPIKFIGTGEKIDMLEAFHPERMASRILGMGDIMTAIERVQQQMDEKKAAELEKKLMSNRFDLTDFLEQLAQLKNMGDMKDLISMMPGVNANELKNLDFDDKVLARTEGIILSMTKKERVNPEIINPSRKRRIAAGSGSKVEDVNRLLKQFENMQKMVKQFGNNKMFNKKKRKGLFGL